MILGKPRDRFCWTIIGTAWVSWGLVLLPLAYSSVLTIFAVICLGLFGTELLAWINAGADEESDDDSTDGPSDDDLKIS